MNRGCLLSNGNLPRNETGEKRLKIGLAMIGEAILKKKGFKPSDPDVFLGEGVKFKELL
jgi:hypothetical protein